MGYFGGGILNSGFSAKRDSCFEDQVFRWVLNIRAIHKWNFQKSWLTLENLQPWLKKQKKTRKRIQRKQKLDSVLIFYALCPWKIFFFAPFFPLFTCASDNPLFIVGFSVCFLCKFRSTPPDRSLHRCHHRIEASGSFFLYCLWVFSPNNKRQSNPLKIKCDCKATRSWHETNAELGIMFQEKNVSRFQVTGVTF